MPPLRIAVVCLALCSLTDIASAQLGSNVIHEYLLTHSSEVQAQEKIPERLPGESKRQISKADAEQAFHSVDEILKWVSHDSGMAIQGEVRRQLATRGEMQQYNTELQKADQGSSELQRTEVVLKKFGLLPRDFELEPFLIKLLREQVLAFYLPQKKTVFLLDWVEPAALRPVLAHELTHVLQDQAVDIDTWTKPKGDERLAAQDEREVARRAVLEGQGMITMVDFVEEPRGQSALSAIADVQTIIEGMVQGKDSPIYRSAPLYMRETLTFPYRYGMQFERTVLSRGGRRLAFEGVLHDPPVNTREIMNPKAYMQHEHVEPLPVPDLMKVAGPEYERFASGPVGAFDVHTITEQFSKTSLADKLSEEWRGGYYVAFRASGANAAGAKSSFDPSELKLVYVSRWSSDKAADQFFEVYEKDIAKKYPGAKLRSDSLRDANGRTAIWQTSEGDIILDRTAADIVICESFPGDIAARLRDAVLPPVSAGR